MMLRVLLNGLFAVLTTTTVMAQQSSIFDLDDAVDPREHRGALFVSSLVLGGASGAVDDYRPLHQNIGFLHLANSFYWRQVQINYKHSQVFGKDMPVSVCQCNGKPIYFPTPPTRDSVPAAPPPGWKSTVQVAWYQAAGPVQPMRRYRLTASWRPIETDLTAIATGKTSHLSGRERSFGLDADTYFHLGGHDVWGSLFYARTARTGTTDNRAQSEFAYMSRFPGWSAGRVLLRATLTIGGVTGRGASGLNVVNPAFEAFWHHSGSDINLHLVWSPLVARSGAKGWKTYNQIAFFADRALLVRLFGAEAAKR